MCKIIELNNRSVLSLSGIDSENFLQNLITNDLNKLSENNAIYAALLTPQGKYLFDFILIKSNKEIYIDCDSSRSSLLYEKLLSYQLRSKIQITIKNNLSVYVIINECNSKFLKMEKKLGFTKFKNQNLCYIDPRNMNLGIRVIGCKKDIKEEFNIPGIVNGCLSDWEKIRISNVIPDPIKDMEINKSFLLEYRFDKIYGVSFTKGCFIGQENTARQKNRGTIKKELVAVSIEGETPKIGTEIIFEKKFAGVMKSSYLQNGLALLRKEIILEAINQNKILTTEKAIIKINI